MKNSIEGCPPVWIALSIGNTHWQWGYFAGSVLIHHWTTQPQTLSAQSFSKTWQDYCEISPALAWHQQLDCPSFPLIRLASVVEMDALPWLEYPNLQVVTLQDIPMEGMYDTLGIDRALAIWGAGDYYGWPILVIDAGTALTFSAAQDTQFQGGAIAPGLGLQLEMLTKKTAALPSVKIPKVLPPRWSQNTPDAILSGVIHSILDSILAFNQQWTHQFPTSQMILTGGDGQQILGLLQQKIERENRHKNLINASYDKHLIFRGLALCQPNTPDSN